MPQYRVEVSPNNRAGCQDKVCKDEAVKILKGELRFATWVEMASIGEGHGSWRWKHWGCVSGSQLQNLRDMIERNGSYDWDMIDGYDELGDHPEVQEKIRRVITQGHIDAEDFNGDPAYNKLGSRGIRGRAKKAAEGEDGEEAKTPTPAKKKRGRKASKAEDDHDEGQEEEAADPPTKKAKKATKATQKSAAEDDNGTTEAKTAAGPAAKAKKAKAATKTAAAAEEAEPEPAPKKTATKGRKTAQKAVAYKEDSDTELEAAVEEEPEPAPKKRRGKGKAGEDGASKTAPAVPAKKRGRK